MHTILKRIRDKAIMRAEKCIDEESWDSAGKAIDIAKDADHICRKHMMLKHEHPDWMK
ncbi:MAG: hypothetical protein IKW19_09895 [Akkermansia sp.]|nr:hypothetical protein [Akkermansia sp.]